MPELNHTYIAPGDTFRSTGPIPAEQARELAGNATSWTRILTDPETETIQSVGRHTYTPPADMARQVRLKSPTYTGIQDDPCPF